MKTYTFNVNVKWTQYGIEAGNLSEAKDKLKDIFLEEFGFTLTDKEIKKIKLEVKGR